MSFTFGTAGGGDDATAGPLFFIIALQQTIAASVEMMKSRRGAGALISRVAVVRSLSSYCQEAGMQYTGFRPTRLRKHRRVKVAESRERRGAPCYRYQTRTAFFLGCKRYAQVRVDSFFGVCVSCVRCREHFWQRSPYLW